MKGVASIYYVQSFVNAFGGIFDFFNVVASIVPMLFDFIRNIISNVQAAYVMVLKLPPSVASSFLILINAAIAVRLLNIL